MATKEYLEQKVESLKNKVARLKRALSTVERVEETVTEMLVRLRNRVREVGSLLIQDGATMSADDILTAMEAALTSKAAPLPIHERVWRELVQHLTTPEERPDDPQSITDVALRNLNAERQHTDSLIQRLGDANAEIARLKAMLEGAATVKSQCNDERACGACYSGQGACETTHPDTAAIAGLAQAMTDKLQAKRGQGYSGWDTDCTKERLSLLLRQCVEKGDPVDVANFCAFLFARGETITPAPSTGMPQGWVPCLVTYDGQDPEEVAYGPKVMMDRLKVWLDRYFATRHGSRPDPESAGAPKTIHPDTAMLDFIEQHALDIRCSTDDTEEDVIWTVYEHRMGGNPLVGMGQTINGTLRDAITQAMAADVGAVQPALPRTGAAPAQYLTRTMVQAAMRAFVAQVGRAPLADDLAYANLLLVQSRATTFEYTEIENEEDAVAVPRSLLASAASALSSSGNAPITLGAIESFLTGSRTVDAPPFFYALAYNRRSRTNFSSATYQKALEAGMVAPEHREPFLVGVEWCIQGLLPPDRPVMPEGSESKA